MTDKQFEWLGALMGLLGSWMVAMDGDLSKYGFIGFLVSNLCWIAFGLRKKAWGLLTMQVGFTGSSLLGLYNRFGLESSLGWKAMLTTLV